MNVFPEFPRNDPAYRPPFDSSHHMISKGEVEHPHLKEALYTSLPEPSAVIDVGCGDGPFEYHHYKTRFIAVDKFHSSNMEGFKEKDTFIQQEISRFPADNESVDAVVLGFILEHVDNPLAFLSEADRVLRSGGWLYVAVPNGYSLEDRLFRLATKIAGSTRGPHIQRFTFETIPEIVHSHTHLKLISWHRLQAGFVWMMHPRIRWIRAPWVGGLTTLRKVGIDLLKNANFQYVFKKTSE